jgi:hypothetical protein
MVPARGVQVAHLHEVVKHRLMRGTIGLNDSAARESGVSDGSLQRDTAFEASEKKVVSRARRCSRRSRAGVWRGRVVRGGCESVCDASRWMPTALEKSGQ